MIFVTGTDTGCGKTTVGRALAAALADRGLGVGILKPVETGCEAGDDGELVPADAVALARAARLDVPVQALCPYRFPLPASPQRAAADAGVTIELDRITAAYEAMRRDRQLVVVEGAGGLLVPLSPELMMPDLARALGLPVLVVARDALGTVNHTLLTVEAVRARGLELAGVVLSETADTRAELHNAEAISDHGDVAVLGTLPWLPDASDDALGRAAAEALDLETLVDLCSRDGS